MEFYFLLLALQDFSKKMFNIINHRIKAIKINLLDYKELYTLYLKHLIR